eukprot:PITA_10310
MNDTIMENVQSMLSNSGLEKNFWVEEVKTTCYLINRSPTIALDGGILEEVWTEACKVEHNEEWKKAMEEEMNSLLENKTWELVNLPKGRKALQNKWVYMIKHEGDEKKERYKARLVVKGFAQKERIDFMEIFSSVVKMSSIRVILVLLLL